MNINDPEVWYCQPDGGQWNVRVRLAARVVIGDIPMMVIYGKSLMGERLYPNGPGVMIVHRDTIYTCAQ